MLHKALLATLAACVALPACAETTQGSFDSNGVKIRYATAGEGEAVVLVHGWMGDATMWGQDARGNPKLDTKGLSGFEVIALDCRGHGRSGKPHDINMYGSEMAEDVVRLLDHLHIRKAHLIGYSMGAFIVGNVAANHPDRVLSIIYGGQAPLIPGVHPAGSEEIETFAKAVNDGKGLGPYILYVWPGEKKPTLEQANAMASSLYGKKDVQAFADAGLSFKGLEVTAEALKKCTAPALFIYGGSESDNSKNAIEDVRKAIGPSEVKVVAGANHVTTPASPEFGSTIVAFLKTHKTK
jgi:pimeloyl-ACP methyl ester carboxylesterase